MKAKPGDPWQAGEAVACFFLRHVQKHSLLKVKRNPRRHNLSHPLEEVIEF